LFTLVNIRSASPSGTGQFSAGVNTLTYYRVDTALMFQSVTHGAVLGALDTVLSSKGLRALSEVERKPTMRDFFSKLGGEK
jgi:hypothetical protein